MSIVEDMLAHAREDIAHEVCGLIVTNGKRARLIRARNIAEFPTKDFDLDPDAWLEVPDDEQVVGIYHSHPYTDAQPSLPDRVGCELTQLPWHIVNPHTEEHVVFEPSGYVAPYERRPYLFGVVDCYSLARDWYAREMQIDLPNFDRKNKFWERRENLFVDNFESCGFVQLRDTAPRRGDAFLVQLRSSIPNLFVIYIGDGMVLHHAQDRLSSKEQFGGVWERHHTHHLRHRSQMEAVNG